MQDIIGTHVRVGRYLLDLFILHVHVHAIFRRWPLNPKYSFLSGGDRAGTFAILI
jgi:hypothetical protein